MKRCTKGRIPLFKVADVSRALVGIPPASSIETPKVILRDLSISRQIFLQSFFQVFEKVSFDETHQRILIS